MPKKKSASKTRSKKTNRKTPQQVFCEKFAEGLAARMEREGKTINQLASELGVSVSTVTHWRSGRRSPLFIQLFGLAKALNCSVQALFPRK